MAQEQINIHFNLQKCINITAVNIAELFLNFSHSKFMNAKTSYDHMP